MSERPMFVWEGGRTSHRTLWIPAKRWLWMCRICRLECTYPKATLPDIYASALRHLEDEHLGTERP